MLGKTAGDGGGVSVLEKKFCKVAKKNIEIESKFKAIFDNNTQTELK